VTHDQFDRIDQTDRIDTLHREFGDLAAADAPDREIDVARAIREGRVRLHRRRLAAYGTVAAAVAATAVLSVLPGGGSGAKPAPAATTTTASAVHFPDPLVPEASFGWLPPGFTTIDYLSQQNQPLLRAGGAVPDGGASQPVIWLKAYPAGTTPTVGRPFYSGGPRTARVEAAPVDGRPAYWVGKSATAPWGPSGMWTLRWQGANGQWAELWTDGMPSPSTQQILHRVAEGATVGAKPVPLPYRISGLPAGLKPSEPELIQGMPILLGEDVPWSTRLTFMVDGKQILTVISPVVKKPKPGSTTGSHSTSSPSGQGTSTANAHRSGSPKQTCVEAHGLSVCTESFYGFDAYRSVGGPQAWLKHFTLLGTDRADWTTKVLD
jgi:hypothetical protein